jgi:hypothetical protein
MTKKLEELFDLPEVSSTTDYTKEEIKQALTTASDLEMTLPSEPENKTDVELDELTTKAMESFENLMSLGMNVEARFSAPIFDSASKMLGHAVTAKLGKAQKKLKETELKMRLMKQQADEARKNGEDTNTVDVKAHVWDRNELIRNLKSQ